MYIKGKKQIVICGQAQKCNYLFKIKFAYFVRFSSGLRQADFLKIVLGKSELIFLYVCTLLLESRRSDAALFWVIRLGKQPGYFFPNRLRISWNWLCHFLISFYILFISFSLSTLFTLLIYFIYSHYKVARAVQGLFISCETWEGRNGEHKRVYLFLHKNKCWFAFRVLKIQSQMLLY